MILSQFQIGEIKDLLGNWISKNVSFELFLSTCHDDVKDAGLPLLPDGVAGSAEEGPVVHGVLRGVAQATLSTLALGSLVGHPGHQILYRGYRQDVR